MVTFHEVMYNGKKYAIMHVLYDNLDVPVVLDYNDFNVIKCFNVKWKCNKNGIIYYINYKNKEIYMHSIVMTMHYIFEDKPIFHKNRINFDNRFDNLTFNNINRIKRTRKKKVNGIINTNKIPTYITYVKPYGKHGERFMVKIKNHVWFTTSIKNVSLKYKLEEAKKYLRKFRKENPNLAMNGELNNEGLYFYKSFCDIVKLGGYMHIKKMPISLSDYYLKEDINGLSTAEKFLLTRNKINY